MARTDNCPGMAEEQRGIDKSALSVNCLKQLRIMQLFDKKRNLFGIAI